MSVQNNPLTRSRSSAPPTNDAPLTVQPPSIQTTTEVGKGGSSPTPPLQKDVVVQAKPGSMTGETGNLGSQVPSSELMQRPVRQSSKKDLEALKESPGQTSTTTVIQSQTPTSLPQLPGRLGEMVARFKDLTSVSAPLQVGSTAFAERLNALAGLRQEVFCEIDKHINQGATFTSEVNGSAVLAGTNSVGFEMLKRLNASMGAMVGQLYDARKSGEVSLPLLKSTDTEGQALWRSLMSDNPFIKMGVNHEGEGMDNQRDFTVQALTNFALLLSLPSARDKLKTLSDYSFLGNSTGKPFANKDAVFDFMKRSVVQQNVGKLDDKLVKHELPDGRKVPVGGKGHVGLSDIENFKVVWSSPDQKSVSIAPPELLFYHELDHLVGVNQGLSEKYSNKTVTSKEGDLTTGKAKWTDDDELRVITKGEGPVRHELGMQPRIHHRVPSGMSFGSNPPQLGDYLK